MSIKWKSQSTVFQLFRGSNYAYAFIITRGIYLYAHFFVQQNK